MERPPRLSGPPAIVFVVDAAGHETVLHDFTGGSDGAVPFGTVIRDSAGNLHGTTSQGGAGFGTVYEIDSAGQFTTFYTFAGGAQGGPALRGPGTRFGRKPLRRTSNFGDNSHFGVLFMLDPAANFTVLYNFDQGGGHNPVGGLARDSDGNLYGTAIDGGASNWGTAFMFSSTGKFPVLHDFSGTDGENPQGAVTLDSSGNPTVPPTSEAPDAGAQCSRFPGNSACLAYQSPTADIADVSTH